MITNSLIFIGVLFLLSPLALCGQQAECAPLEVAAPEGQLACSPARPGLAVTVTNLAHDSGQVRVAVYNTQKSWLETPLMGLTVKSQGSQAVAHFTGLPAGTYAVSVFEDDNNNGELDTNFLGIPEECYGFSCEAAGLFGPPDFEEASFAYDGKAKAITIKLD